MVEFINIFFFSPSHVPVTIALDIESERQRELGEHVLLRNDLAGLAFVFFFRLLLLLLSIVHFSAFGASAVA